MADRFLGNLSPDSFHQIELSAQNAHAGYKGVEIQGKLLLQLVEHTKTLTAEVARLKEALKPFGKIFDDHRFDIGGGVMIFNMRAEIKIEDLRNAHQALEEEK